MTVYIDAQDKRGGIGHRGPAGYMLWADKPEQLHEFAKRLGLDRDLFVDHERYPAYYVPPRFRTKALDKGAEPMSYWKWTQKKDRARETDIGRNVVVWMREWGWDVWQEIAFEGGGARADIIGLRHGILAVVETKTSLTFDVIAQARRWVAHYRFVAVPVARDSDGRGLALHICRDLGIGVLEVSRVYSDGSGGVRELVGPRLVRMPRDEARRRIDILGKMPRDYAPAGSTSGNGWSPWSSYKGTMERIRRYLLIHPGATVADIVGNVEHHYAGPSSAKSAIPKWLQTVEKTWCRTERDGPRLRFYVREGSEAVPVGDFRA